MFSSITNMSNIINKEEEKEKENKGEKEKQLEINFKEKWKFYLSDTLVKPVV